MRRNAFDGTYREQSGVVQMSYRTDRVDAGSAGFIWRLFCPVTALVEAWQSLGAEQHYRG
jgi:hypothetical protein